jgi:hypothetical protein
VWKSTSPRPDDEQGVSVVGRLVRLLDEVEELNRELERIEPETQEAIGRGSLLRLRGPAEAQ